MTLAQGTELLLLDEPTTFLDLSHALDVLDLVDELSSQGRTVVMVLHDLNLAIRYSDHLVDARRRDRGTAAHLRTSSARRCCTRCSACGPR
ncbi:Vitamin B12 import ATP-binding protein BtuD [Tsukamurella paurometabola]